MSRIIKTTVTQDLPDVVEDERLVPDIAHAYCFRQLLGLPPYRAWCGHMKYDPPTMREYREDDRCVVCVDMLKNGIPCPHCSKETP